jgi:hypothetical protein
LPRGDFGANNFAKSRGKQTAKYAKSRDIQITASPDTIICQTQRGVDRPLIACLSLFWAGNFELLVKDNNYLISVIHCFLSLLLLILILDPLEIESRSMLIAKTPDAEGEGTMQH